MNRNGREFFSVDHAVLDAYTDAYRRGEAGDPGSWLRARTPGDASGVDVLRALGLLIRHRDMPEIGRPAEAPDDVTPSLSPSPSQGHPAMSGLSAGGIHQSPSSAAFRDWLRTHQIELLGSLDVAGGGMGKVSLAWHRVLKRELVLKMAGDPSKEARFRREIEIHGKLKGHPHIAVVRSPLLHEDGSILVVDYAGPSLGHLLKTTGRFPWPDACALVRQAALGLGHAHAEGVVHRDVKPGNLVRSTRDGVLNVIDWGLARDRDSPPQADETLTSAGCFLGTPAYCPPEQASDASSATAASDLYGLGCTWYELMTGSPPFQVGRYAQRKAHAEATVPALAAELGVPEEVEHVLRKLLEKNPGDRYGSTEEFIRALDRARGGDGKPRGGVAVDPSSLIRKIAAVTLAAVAVAIVAWMLWPSPPRPRASLRDLIVEVVDSDAKPSRIGAIGSAIFEAIEGDDATIRADLSSPAYAYLIAFLPDGRMELCSPADESARPELDGSPSYPPPGDLKPVFGFRDGAGLQAFAVVVSHSALPAFKDWKAKAGPPPWHAVNLKEIDPGLVWRSDGREIKTLPAEKEDPDRNAGYRSRNARGAVADLTDWLKAVPGVDLVQVKAFAVVPPKP